jgi:hypothetical protein
MNKKEFESLKETWQTKPILGIDDLEDQSERTLLWGYTCERDSWHVYLKDGEIHAVMYDYPDILKYHDFRCASDNPKDWIPNKRLYPEACDYEFCKLLKEYGCYLPFTTWNDDREPKQYHGKILSELKNASN